MNKITTKTKREKTGKRQKKHKKKRKYRYGGGKNRWLLLLHVRLDDFLYFLQKSWNAIGARLLPRPEPRLPDLRCILCEKSHEEVGGRRIISGASVGIFLSDRYLGGGNPKYPFVSIPLREENLGDFPQSGFFFGLPFPGKKKPKIKEFIVLKGKKGMWSEDLKSKVRRAFLSGRWPWFCQKCAHYTCRKCGSPLNYPPGADVLSEKGCISHCAIFPVDFGCSNPNCRDFQARNMFVQKKKLVPESIQV